MPEYDTALKLALREPAEETLRELVGEPVVRWHNVELPEVRATRVDLLGETADGEQPRIEVGILGATGIVGQHLVKFLKGHP